jgi:hypothetical protein
MNYIHFAQNRVQWLAVVDTNDTVTCIPIARPRLGKHIPTRANARDSRTYIARQQRGKHASSIIQAGFSVWSVPRGYKRTQSEDATDYSKVSD